MHLLNALQRPSLNCNVHVHRSVLSPLQQASSGRAPRGPTSHEGLKTLKGPARWAPASPAAPGKENSPARGNPHEGVKSIRGPARWAPASPAAPGKENSPARGVPGPCGNPGKPAHASPMACPGVRAGLPAPSSLPIGRSRFAPGAMRSAAQPGLNPDL